MYVVFGQELLIAFFFRRFGITILKPEKAGWFPSEELREYHGLEEHKITKVERVLFGFREDGREGILFPTYPKSHVLPRSETVESPPLFENPTDEEVED